MTRNFGQACSKLLHRPAILRRYGPDGLPLCHDALHLGCEGEGKCPDLQVGSWPEGRSPQADALMGRDVELEECLHGILLLGLNQAVDPLRWLGARAPSQPGTTRCQWRLRGRSRRSRPPSEHRASDSGRRFWGDTHDRVTELLPALVAGGVAGFENDQLGEVVGLRGRNSPRADGRRLRT